MAAALLYSIQCRYLSDVRTEPLVKLVDAEK